MKYLLTYILFGTIPLIAFSQHENIERHFNTYQLNYTQDSTNSFFIKDTLLDEFYLKEAYYKTSIHGGMSTGSNGKPILFYDYFKRDDSNNFLFNNYLKYNYTSSENLTYYNARKPFARFDFYTGAPGYEEVMGIFTINSSPFLNFGAKYHSIKTDGFFINSLSKLKNFSFWESYTGKKYQNHFNLTINSHSSKEFGGIANDSIYEDTDARIDNLDVNLNNASTEQKSSKLFYAHEYRFGNLIRDTITTESDTSVSIKYEGSFSLYQDFTAEKSWRKYTDVPGGFYNDIFLDSTQSLDSTGLQKISHQFGVIYTHKVDSVDKYRIFGGIINEFNQYFYTNDEKLIKNNFLKLNIKSLNNKINAYHADLRYGITGRRQSDFEAILMYKHCINDFHNLRLRNKTVHRQVNYFYENYSSNHFYWSNSFVNEKFSKLQLEYLYLPRYFTVSLNYALHQDLIFIDELGHPYQYDKTVQIISAGATKDFKLGPFGLKTDILFQKVINDSVIKLPEILAYAGVYFQKGIFKNKMTLRTGVDSRYRTGFFANSYIPATGFYSVQDNINIGQSFMVNAYLSFKVKRLRAFFRYNNIGRLISNTSSYSLLHYPEQASNLRFGFSWEFYD